MRQLKITKSITNREDASLDKYLEEISKIDLITVEREVELAQEIRKWSKVALNELVNANLRFVVSVAKQFQNQWLSLPDLIEEGNLGLIKAAEKFDETRGFKLISYAVWWIRQSILQALAEQSRMVRLPNNQIGSVNKLNRASNKFEQINEREPSPAELAEMLDFPDEKIQKILQNVGNKRYISTDTPDPLRDDSSAGIDRYQHTKPDYTSLLREDTAKEIEEALSILTYKESDVVRRFYGWSPYTQEQTLEEIAWELSLAEERIRQIKKRAERKMRGWSHSKYFGKSGNYHKPKPAGIKRKEDAVVWEDLDTDKDNQKEVVDIFETTSKEILTEFQQPENPQEDILIETSDYIENERSYDWFLQNEELGTDMMYELQAEDIKKILVMLYKRGNKIDADVLKMYFGAPPYPTWWLTYIKIAKKLKKAVWGIYQIKKTAIGKFKYRSKNIDIIDKYIS